MLALSFRGGCTRREWASECDLFKKRKRERDHPPTLTRDQPSAPIKVNQAERCHGRPVKLWQTCAAVYAHQSTLELLWWQAGMSTSLTVMVLTHQEGYRCSWEPATAHIKSSRKRIWNRLFCNLHSLLLTTKTLIDDLKWMRNGLWGA